LQRGDVYRLPPPRRTRGHEQRGGRLAIVVQTSRFIISTVIVAPTSRSAQPAIWRPEVVIGQERTRVLVEQMRAIDTDLLEERFQGRVGVDDMHDIDVALAIILGLGQ
jgi:mRNA interferase MazF